MTEEQPDGLFEVKVPIFCEFIYQQNLASTNFDEDGKPFKEYISDSKEEEGSFYCCAKCSLPGFPAIKCYIHVYFENNMDCNIEIESEYDTYLFDVDLSCTINNGEPKHFRDTYDSGTTKYGSETNVLLECSKECVGCAACKDKIFVVRVEGFITVKYVENIQISYQLYEDEKLYDENDTKDFVFVVEGKQIWVHKSILIKHSTVFARMLDSDKWKEATENKILIPDFPFKIVEFAIKGCYSKNLFKSITKEDYLMLYQFADKYDIEKLKKAIKKYICLTPGNVIKYANFFLQNYADELVICCIDYILVCTQNSFPIKDIEMLDPRINSIFVSRTLRSPVLKKDPKFENRTVYNDKLAHYY